MRFHKLEAYLRSPFGRAMMGTGKGSADFGELVREAQKFYVGDVCTLETIGSTAGRPANEIPLLPYEVCVFEMEDLDPKGVRRPFFLMAEDLPERSTIRVHAFTTYPVPPYMGEDLYPHTGCIEVHRSTSTYDTFINKNTLKFLDGGDGYDRLADATTLEQSMRAGMEWLWRFLLVLNCSNVQTVEVAAPKLLNRKRAAKKKPPIYSYKTLVLTARQRRLESLGGTHDSPRIHLRRGHIKRRKTGNFWWQPHVVGDRARGIVVKDYRADRLLSAGVEDERE